jgi:hypothetical protein
VTFDEAIEMLHGLAGRVVEVGVRVPDVAGESVGVAGFSGRVSRLQRSSAVGPERWYVWFVEEGEPKPMPGHLVLFADTFENATVEGSGLSLEEVIAEEDEESGTTWEVVVRQFGVIVTITVYV